LETTTNQLQAKEKAIYNKVRAQMKPVEPQISLKQRAARQENFGECYRKALNDDKEWHSLSLKKEKLD
jgi:hypothetical protein